MNRGILLLTAFKLTQISSLGLEIKSFCHTDTLSYGPPITKAG